VVSRQWLKLVLWVNVAVVAGAAVYLGLRVVFGELLFCEFGDSMWGQQRWTGVIPEPSCVYTDSSQGVRGVHFVEPARLAPVHLMLVCGVTIAIATVGLSRSRRS